MCGTERTWPVVNCHHCLKCVSVINAIGASHQHILSDLCVKTTAHCVKRQGGGVVFLKKIVLLDSKKSYSANFCRIFVF